MSKAPLLCSLPKRTLLVLVVLLSLYLTAASQNIQRPNATSDFSKRSGLRVDPSTLGLNIEIPLGNYPGRAGTDTPVVLNYSSKLYQIKFKQGPGEKDFYSIWAEPTWSDNAMAGWTTNLGLPTGRDVGTEWYTNTGVPTSTFWPGIYLVRHIQIILPDGSSHDLRHGNPIANWPVGQPAPSYSGLYYAVDGSQLRYDYDSKTLYMPDGSRYILGDQNPTLFLDRNGNKRTYNPQNGTWTDTLGRGISPPFTNSPAPASFVPQTPGDYPYALPGVGGSPLNYVFRWKLLGNALSNPSQPLLPLCAETDPNNPGVNYPGPWLFYTGYPESVACGNGSGFNPLVLAEIILPTGQSYKFTYNAYGEIDKFVYPSGGYERYRYDQIQAADWMRGIYAQANRGVVERWISPKGDGSDEQHFAYSAGYGTNFSQPYKVTITAPDSTRTERFLYSAASQDYPFGFRDVRVSKSYEERFYSATNQLLRRTLSKWTASNQNGYANARDPHLDKQVEITFDTSGSALARTTLNAYDAAQNLTTISKYDFYALDQSTAQTIGVDSVFSGTFLRTDETTFLVNDPAIDANTRSLYAARNLVNLASAKKVIGPSGIVAQGLTRYDEYSFIPSGSTIYWTDPGTNLRGNPTTSSSWLNTTNSYFSTHAQFDQYGNVRKTWDARDVGLSNPAQIDYSSASQFSYPTTSTSSVPDSTAVHGANTALVTTTIYDFTTGAVLSTTDPNNQTTSYTYNDVLNRVKTVASADGGLTTYNYSDVPGNLYVQTTTKLTSSQDTNVYQYFDGLNRPNRSFLSVGGASFITGDTQFDGMGRTSRVSNSYFSAGAASAINPSGQWTTTTYDALGRARTMTSPDGSVVRTDYDGNRVLVTDPAGKQRLSKSNALGQIKEVWEITGADDATESIPSFLNHPEVTTGYRTAYSYDTLGNLLSTIQQKGVSGTIQQRSFAYNSLSQITDATNPESGHTSYDYDANGNLLHKTDSRLVTITYAYDAFNRNVSAVASNDPAGTPTVNRYYDGFRDGVDNTSLVNRKARLWQTETSGTAGSRTTINNTDPAGRPTSISQQFLNGTWSQLFVTKRTYNLAGGVTAQTYPSGRTVSYAYDAAGRVANFNGNIGDGVLRTYATNIAYDESGRLKEEQFGTNTALYHKLHYNIRGQLNDIRLSTASWSADEWNWNRGTIVNYYATADLTCPNAQCRFNGGPDNNGSMRQSQYWIPANDQMSSYNWTEDRYNYDSLSRLKSVAEYHGSQSGFSGQDFTQVYDYDRYGNRTINQTLTQGNGAPKPWFSVDPATNRLTVPNGQSGNMHYDPAGNLDNDSYSSFGTANGTATRTFDANNLMTVVKDANQQLVSTYTYNGEGQRVRRKVSGVETWQVYGMDGELLAEYEFGAAPITATKEYGYRNGGMLVTVTSGDTQRLKRFVKNLFYNALVRDASPTELQQNMSTLAAAGVQGETELLASARAIARGLFESSEYVARGRSDTQYVTDLYNSYLQRGPDTAGLNFWVGNTQANGRGATLNAFEVSSEFATVASTVYGTNSAGDNQRVEHFVAQFYLGALQRTPTSTELTQQSQRLNNAAAVSQSQVVTEAQTMGGEIFQATNYNSTHTTEQYVTDLYVAFLQRTPDSSGLNFWINNTNANGRAATLNAFKVSGEYAELSRTLYREVFWMVSDHLGTARMIVDKSGSLASIKRHDYLPFGEELGLVAGRTTTQGYNLVDNIREKFTKKERDTETGLDYFGARYYSSVQGRFIGADIAGPNVSDPQTLNKYLYTLNNPLRYIDPDGRYEEDVHYTLTKALAEAAGFSSQHAEMIAQSNQMTDQTPGMSPGDEFSTAALDVEARRKYHFTTEQRRQDMLSDFVDSAVERYSPIENGLDRLGVYLHAEQDSYSHAGYGPVLGHAIDGHGPDKTYCAPGKADNMARDTYNRLTGAATVLYNNQKISFQYKPLDWGVLNPLVQSFNRAKTPEEKQRIANQITALARENIERQAQEAIRKQQEQQRRREHR